MALLKDIAFEIIQKCPNNCLHCSSEASRDSKHIVQLDIFKKTIDGAVCLGLGHISLSGGEPFEHPDLLNMISYAKYNGLTVSLYTSGLCSLDNGVKSVSQSLLRKFKEVGLDRIMFNLPSLDPEIYNLVMGTKGHLPGVLSAIKASKREGLHTEIHFVPMAVNLTSIDDILLFAHEHDIKVSFLRLVIQGRAVRNEKQLFVHDSIVKKYICETKARFEEQSIYVNTRRGVPLSDIKDENCCTAAKSKVIIRYDGTVFPCEAYKSSESIKLDDKVLYPDNIHQTPIEVIWEKSTFLQILRAEMRDFFHHDCGSEICPAQYRNFLLGGKYGY